MEYIDGLQRSRPLLTVLLRLTGLCIKTRQNRAALTRPELRAVSVMLRLLALCLRAEPELVAGAPGGPTVTQQLLQVTVLLGRVARRVAAGEGEGVGQCDRG